MRAVFWERDSWGSEENLAELYVRCNSHAHEEGNAFTMKTIQFLKESGMRRCWCRVWTWRRHDRLLLVNKTAAFSLTLPVVKMRNQP